MQWTEVGAKLYKQAAADQNLWQHGLNSAQKYLGAGIRNLASNPGILQKPVTSAMSWISEYPGAGHANPLSIAARQVGGKLFDLPVWNATPNAPRPTYPPTLRDTRPSLLQERVTNFNEFNTNNVLAGLVVPGRSIKPTVGQVVTQAAIASPQYVNNKLKLNAVIGDSDFSTRNSVSLPSRNPIIAAHELGHVADPVIQGQELAGPNIPDPPSTSSADLWTQHFAERILPKEHGASERALQYLTNAGATPEELAAARASLSGAYDTYRLTAMLNKARGLPQQALFNQTPYQRAQDIFKARNIPRSPPIQYPASYPGGLNDQRQLALQKMYSKELDKIAPSIVAELELGNLPAHPTIWNKPKEQ